MEDFSLKIGCSQKILTVSTIHKYMIFLMVIFFYCRLHLDYHKIDLQIQTNYLSAKLPSFCFVIPTYIYLIICLKKMQKRKEKCQKNQKNIKQCQLTTFSISKKTYLLISHSINNLTIPRK